MARSTKPATKRTYSNEERASALAYLTSNDGNILRTSKETGIPEQTIREWKNKWGREGVPQEVQEALPAATGDFIDKAEHARDMAIDRIIVLIPKSTSLNELNRIMGTLTDKLDRVKGLASQRIEITHHNPSLDEQNALIQKLAQQSLDAVDLRHGVIDAEFFEEQAPMGLPAPHPTEE